SSSSRRSVPGNSSPALTSTEPPRRLGASIWTWLLPSTERRYASTRAISDAFMPPSAGRNPPGFRSLHLRDLRCASYRARAYSERGRSTLRLKEGFDGVVEGGLETP